MLDHAHLIDLIEGSIATDPSCPVCHDPTTIRNREGRIWLECSATPEDEPTTIVARLGAILLSHPRRLVVDLSEDVAA